MGSDIKGALTCQDSSISPLDVWLSWFAPVQVYFRKPIHPQICIIYSVENEVWDVRKTIFSYCPVVFRPRFSGLYVRKQLCSSVVGVSLQLWREPVNVCIYREKSHGTETPLNLGCRFRSIVLTQAKYKYMLACQTVWTLLRPLAHGRFEVHCILQLL